MTTQLNFLKLFRQFISSSRRGKRLNKDGTRIKEQSIANYDSCEKLLQEFEIKRGSELVIYQVKGSNTREHNRLKKHYANFYKEFTCFLYKEKDCHDNYVGQTIKQVRTFYGWLNNEQGILTGNYFKNFFVCKEDVPIVTLSLKQVQFLSFDKNFELSLPDCLKRTKDIFIFGCMTSLRYSDLALLKQANLEFKDNSYYLKTRSKKTNIDSYVKLPPLATCIIEKYRSRRRKIFCSSKSKLLPITSLDRFNTNIKKIGELAGWTDMVQKVQTKSGLRERLALQRSVRFCDLLSSHIMRRTSITTMLTSGMPEFVVRKISGHTNGSKAFYRYVNVAQNLMDREIEKMHQHFITER